jgi:hypothetical protein
MVKKEKNNPSQGVDGVRGIEVSQVYINEAETLPLSLSEGEFGQEDLGDDMPEAAFDCIDVRAYEKQFNDCLAMAFDGVALAMLTDWGSIPFTLAVFYRDNTDAPCHAGLMQVGLQHKVAILPDQDPRRVELALELFRAYIVGVNKIVNADFAVQPAPLPSGPSPSRDRDGPFDREDERFEASDTGKSLLNRARAE